MKVFLINLRRSTMRRQWMEQQLGKIGLDYELFPAINGKQLTAQQLALYSDERALRKSGRSLASGEIGTALTHLTLYQRIIDEKLGEALILEDDIRIHRSIHDVLAHRHKFPKDWDLVKFRHSRAPVMPFTRTHICGRFYTTRFRWPVALTSAYMINEAGAQKLLEHGFPVGLPSDGLTGRFRMTGARVYGILPRCVLPRGFPSDIWT